MTSSRWSGVDAVCAGYYRSMPCIALGNMAGQTVRFNIRWLRSAAVAVDINVVVQLTRPHDEDASSAESAEVEGYHNP